MEPITSPATHVLLYGKFRGKTIEEVNELKGDQYLKWLQGRSAKQSPEDAAAIKSYRAKLINNPSLVQDPPAEEVDHDASHGPSTIKAGIKERARRLVAAEDLRAPRDAKAIMPSASVARRTDPAPAAPHGAPEVLEVIKPYALVYPDGSLRGGAGTLIFADDPLMNFVPQGSRQMWSQRYKCRALDGYKHPTPIKSRRWAREFAKCGYSRYQAEVSPGVFVQIKASAGSVPAREVVKVGDGQRKETPLRGKREDSSASHVDDMTVPTRVEVTGE